MSDPKKNKNNSLYPQVDQSNPDAISSSATSSTSIYPPVDMKDLAENLFPDNEEPPQNPNQSQPSNSFESSEEVLITVPGTVVHLIDKQRSVELASGELSVVRLRQGENVVAVFARVGEEIQWPLAKDEAAVKLDESHYFFTLRVPPDVVRSDEDEGDDEGGGVVQGSSEADENVLNYGVTIASKGQEGVLDAFDSILDHYSSFSVQKVAEGVDGAVVAKETSPEEMAKEVDKREKVKGSATVYWTTLAPNVEDYSNGVAKMIAAGSGQLIRGILWCGDVTVDRLKWGHDFLKNRLAPGSNAEIHPLVQRRIRSVRRMTKRSEKIVSGVLSGVLKVSGFFTSSIANSTVGKKFFSLLPGEIVLASLDGFNKVIDAVEVAGRDVMSTSSVVTTGLVSHRYGEQAGKVTKEGLEAAGYGIGSAWAVWKIRKAFNPKSVIKPTTIARHAAKEKTANSKTALKK